jgi:branched-chain amino acid transport system substrate-binding protein
LGKPIAVISADHQIKPDIGAGIARQWYDVDHVDLIVDVGFGGRSRGSTSGQ